VSLPLRVDGHTRLLPPAYFWLALATAVVLHLAWPVADLLDLPWTLSGLVPLTAGAMLNLCADRAFKQRATTVKPYEGSTCLLAQGVFGLSRHPMYLGMVLVLAGVALLLGSLAPWLAVAAFAALMQRVFVPLEERMLAAQFGDEWSAYRRRVRQWI
jgi:protein-S-isoprenylcysteine O-methyltransferase Ste14